MAKIIDIEELQDELKPLAEYMGMEMFLDFCQEFGGSSIYIPHRKSILRHYRNQEILRRYDGTNSKELAKEFGLTDVYIKHMIRKLK